jgi:acetyltransferase-like isoleucine patch superfamily enzyme
MTSKIQQAAADGAPTVHPTALVETPSIGRGTRIWAYTHILRDASIGRDCNIGDHCFVEGGAVIGNAVTVKNGNAIWEGVTLEDGVFVGPGVVFTNDLFPRSPRLAQASERYATREWLAPTLVREGASLGAGAVILAGTSIGKFALVAAAAVVTKDVPAHALVLGSPARVQGWVCQCGAALSFEEGLARCQACSLRFRRSDDKVVAMNSAQP